MKKHGYEAHMNGHEHLTAYSYMPTSNDTVRPEKLISKLPHDDHCDRGRFFDKPKDMGYPMGYLTECWAKREWFHEEEYPKVNRRAEFSKGDFIHDFTMGASGNFSTKLCQKIYDRSGADFKYATNNHHGFLLVTVTPEEFNVKYKGVKID